MILGRQLSFFPEDDLERDLRAAGQFPKGKRACLRGLSRVPKFRICGPEIRQQKDSEERWVVLAVALEPDGVPVEVYPNEFSLVQVLGD